MIQASASRHHHGDPGQLEYRQHSICKQTPAWMHYKPISIIRGKLFFVNNQILDKEGKRTMIIEEIYAGVAISTIYLKVQREDNAAWIQIK